MEIQKTSAQLFSAADSKSLSRLLSQLKQGNTLDALVTAKLAENSFMLKLAGGQAIQAQTQSVLEVGQLLKLEVIKSGNVPELKIITSKVAVQTETSVVSQAFREFLPKQQDLLTVMVGLKQVLTQFPEQSNAPRLTALQPLVALMPSQTDLTTPEGLQQAITNSGIFMEAKQAHSTAGLQGDLKAQLLSLLDTLAPASSSSVMSAMEHTVLNDVKSGLARIVMDQLASLPQDDQRQQVWQLAIPFQNGQHTETIKLKINHEKKSTQPADDQPSSWSVVLELNPPGLSPLKSRISVEGEVVDTFFWSDQVTTTDSIKANLDKLELAYQQAGLVVGQLDAWTGKSPHHEADETIAIPLLLDERV
jgi:hypothetical protein